MDTNLKNCKHNINHQKAQTNTQKSKQNSLKSRDSGLSPEPSYDKKNSNDNSEYMINEMIEIRTQLQKSNSEKEDLKMQIHKLYEEKRNFEGHLEAISSAHDSRITEMHCVIVELKNRLKAQQNAAIMEETEPEGSVSDLSFQEGSVYNSEMSNFDHEVIEFNEEKIKLDDQRLKIQNNNRKSSPSLPTPHYSSSQIECLQEEVLQLRGQLALLQAHCFFDQNIHKVQALNTDSKEEPNDNDRSNYTSDDLCETADIYDVVKDQNLSSNDDSSQIFDVSRLTILEQKTCQYDVAKVAERVKLKRTMEENFVSKISSKDTLTTEMAEHLVSNFMHVDTNVESTSPSSFQGEISRLQRRVEQLKLQNTVLSLTLVESKQHCDKLYLLCGKYESNAVALQQALNCNDRSIEAYDCLLALLESKLAVLENVEYADQNRRAAETVAYSLLERLKKENSFYGKSSAPWQEGVIILPETENICWLEEHDRMLRNHVSKFKGQRALIQNTVVDLESPFNADVHDFSTKSQLNKVHQKHIDIEQAILMQEVVSLRQELCDLKEKAKQSEKEKLFANEKLQSLQAALNQLQSQLNVSESNPRDRLSYSELEYNVSIERELVEALSRECRLKTRLQGLAESLETATKGGNANCSTKIIS